MELLPSLCKVLVNEKCNIRENVARSYCQINSFDFVSQIKKKYFIHALRTWSNVKGRCFIVLQFE